MRWLTRRDEAYLDQLERGGDLLGKSQVPKVHRIECAAKNSERRCLAHAIFGREYDDGAL